MGWRIMLAELSPWRRADLAREPAWRFIGGISKLGWEVPYLGLLERVMTVKGGASGNERADRLR